MFAFFANKKGDVARMKVTVEGVITSKEVKTKTGDDGKTRVSTELLLAQPGEKLQAAIRLQGDRTQDYELYVPAVFEGQLMSWKTRDGVGMMVMVQDDAGGF